MQEILGSDFTIFRAMPNTAIAIRESITCICKFNAKGEDEQYISSLV